MNFLKMISFFTLPTLRQTPRKAILLIFTFILGSSNLQAQAKYTDRKLILDECFPIMPEPPFDLNSLIHKKVEYPSDALQNGTTGRVVVRFLVRKNGNIDSLRVIKAPRPSLALAVVRALEKMPRWKPGLENGKPADIWFVYPVNFSIPYSPYRLY